MLRIKPISYIVSGDPSVDLVHAVNLLGEHFGIRTLLLEGGGRINAAFLPAYLIDEVSLLVAPGIDGRHDIPAVLTA
jgi:5-amino-6-(5-phosphoribosylamino)uracil reductase